MNKCVVGLQWGDEGKGKVVDIFAECEGEGGTTIYAQLDSVIIPAFEPAISLSVEPGGYTFLNPQEVVVLKVTATVRDGTGFPLNNALVTFENTGGMYFCCDSATAAQDPLPPNWFPGDPPYWRFEQYTGPNPPPDLVQSPAFSQNDGQAIMFMRAIEETDGVYPGVFNNPVAPDMSCEISAYLVSDPSVTSDPIIVTFRRVL